MPHRRLISCGNSAFLTLSLLSFYAAVLVKGFEPLSISGRYWGLSSGTQVIDLLSALNLHNTTRKGVATLKDSRFLRPAYELQGDSRDLRLPQAVFEEAAALLRASAEFSVIVRVRQEQGNSGTIVAFSRGANRYFELQSSGRKNEIRLHYTSQRDALVHVETFPYRLADDAWHQVAVTVSGFQVELLIDCHPLYKRLLVAGGAPDRNFTLNQLQLWIGQRNSKHSYFKGSIEEVKLVSGTHGYLSQCPQLDSTCPTCGQFSLLQNTVQELAWKLEQITKKLEIAEERIDYVEQCDCLKSCSINGSVYSDGASWQNDCDICSCVHGEVKCRPVQCPKVTCKNPVVNAGECCETCLKHCVLRGVIYDHGEQVVLKECLECECKDGSMQCTRIDPDVKCPKLKCPPAQQFSVPGECCKFCPGTDYCAKGHTCHTNATCLNLQTTYACQCIHGFQGDGHTCSDVDECLQEGGFDGHHCHSNTRCVNTMGSYVCECLSGYRRFDKFNCVELDECTTGQHQCHANARCVNTMGSYECQCVDGYTGDGYHCYPICDEACLNGGECTEPNTCTCRQGYVGRNCELDLDECEAQMDNCDNTSECVNMPGWYYCKCKNGYQSIFHDNNLATFCKDIDECKEYTHTCHPSSVCVNTDGGFQCACPNTAPNCQLNCIFEGKEVEDGSSVSPAGQPCRRCDCNRGVMQCHEPVCNCSMKGSASDKCCPQCDPDQKCAHQELTHVVFRSGDQWIYQCQTCECLYGETDCWPMECPPLVCDNPIKDPGDCCPRCTEDPCSFSSASNLTKLTESPCIHSNRVYQSGSQWRPQGSRCTECNCKNGNICCSFDFRCANKWNQLVASSTIRGIDVSATPTNTSDDEQIIKNNTTFISGEIDKMAREIAPITAIPIRMQMAAKQNGDVNQNNYRMVLNNVTNTLNNKTDAAVEQVDNNKQKD